MIKLSKHERFLSTTGAQPESSMRTHTRSLMTIHNAWNMAKTNLRVSICYFLPEPVIFGYFDLRHQRDNTSTDLEASPDRWSQDSGIDAIHLQNEPQWQETNLQDMCAQRRFRSACARRRLIWIFAGRILYSQGCIVSLWGQRELWSDCADAQADSSLRWAHMSEGTVSDITDHIVRCDTIFTLSNWTHSFLSVRVLLFEQYSFTTSWCV